MAENSKPFKNIFSKILTRLVHGKRQNLAETSQRGPQQTAAAPRSRITARLDVAVSPPHVDPQRLTIPIKMPAGFLS